MSAPLLLDTCAAIWMAEAAHIEPAAVAAMNESATNGTPVLISPISAWERALLVAKGRLRSPLPPKVWFDRILTTGGLKLAPLTPDILADASFLPEPLHRDPADRIIIATARSLDLTIVTRDVLILDYAGLGHVRAIAC
ncbi:type II toxin-antitoxin system VapC family toxin [Devosia alba]|uniref:type II toxin-antitoxin system VapC family toxin n=1 Tax=Devosia alba TaxID=3152360 RepID=UPI003265AB4D